MNNCIRYGHIINLEGDCLHGDSTAMPELARYVAEVLRLRRSLRDRIWDSRLIDPSRIRPTGSTDVQRAVHESQADSRLSLVLNHFSAEPQSITVHPTTTASAVVHRPFSQAERVDLPVELTIARDEVVIVELAD